MAPIQNKRRRVDKDERRPKKKIRVKKQAHYHSSSEDEEDEVPVVEEKPKAKPKSILKTNLVQAQAEESEDEDETGLDGLDELERNTALNVTAANVEADNEEDDEPAADQVLNGAEQSSADEESDSDLEDSDDISMTSSQAARTKKKRNDPEAFATSISKILDTKLTSTKRADPVLSRSKALSESKKREQDARLEAAAKAQLKAEKKQSLEKGRIKDVLGLETTSVDTGRLQEEEKRLKKTAQRGVVRLFNAVRAAQVRAEEGMKQARQDGTVGIRQREEKVQEMSKEGFLELISRGGAAGAKA